MGTNVKHKPIILVSLILIFIALIFGCLMVEDSYHKMKEDESTVHYELKEDNEPRIKAYDVEGLSPEEIDKYLNDIRSHDAEE